jgi:hypothetical protein
MTKKQQRPVETVEEFKLRIAAIMRAMPEQIPTPSRPPAIKRATNRKAKRGTTSREVRVLAAPLRIYRCSQNSSELCAFASRASASGFQRNRLREMLYILARFASPSQRTLLLGRSDLIYAFNAVSRIASSAGFSALSVGSTNSIPSAEVF